jgi:hypothetical protein
LRRTFFPLESARGLLVNVRKRPSVVFDLQDLVARALRAGGHDRKTASLSTPERKQLPGTM